MKIQKTLIALTLLVAVAAHAQSKKELVQKVLLLQQPGIEQLARQLTEQPAAQMLQQAGMALNGVPAEKREAAGKAIQDEARKYAEQSVPLIRDRAIKLAPTTIGAVLEEKFSEDELKQLVAWFESPVNKKYAQTVPTMNEALLKKLVEEGKPLVDPKLLAMDANIRKILEGAGAGKSSAPPATKGKTGK